MLTLLLSPAAWAQHIWIDPRADAKIALSDNSTLVETGKEADIALDVAPGINMRIEGARLKGAVDYSYDYLYFVADQSTEQRHTLFGLVNYEAWEDHLTFDVRASARETFIDRQGGLSNTIANRSSNRRLVQNYTGGATFKGGLRDYADWRINYRYGLTLTPADNVDDETLTTFFSDSRTQELSASLGSGDRFNNLEWRFYATRNTVNRSLDVRNYLNETAGGEVWLKFSRQFAIVGAMGYARNNLQSETLSSDGLSWEAGARWTPGGKLDLTVRKGEEGNRKTWYGQLRYLMTTRLDLSGSYTDTISANSIVMNGNLQGYQFDENGGIIDNQGLPVDESDLQFSLSDVDFRRQAASLVLTWRHRRDQVYINGTNERRTYDGVGDTATGSSTSWGLSSGFKHKINENSTLSGTLSYRRSRFEDTTRVDNYIAGGLNWSKTFSPYLQGTVSLNHTQRLSNEAGADLSENTLTIFLRGTF